MIKTYNKKTSSIPAKSQTIVIKHIASVFIAAIFVAMSIGANAIPTGHYTIQQASTNRYLDGHLSKKKDFQLVTRKWQDDDSQKWLITDLGGNKHRIQHRVNSRYVDAHTSSKKDFNFVTRPFQDNDTQKWIITSLGNDKYLVQHAHNNQYMDAHESSKADYRVVSRKAQNNDSQRWIIKRARIFDKSDLCSSHISWSGDRLKYCRDKSINNKDSNVKRAVIYVHGTGSKAKIGYDAFIKDRKAEGFGSETTIIAPQFLRKNDHAVSELGSNYQYWSGNQWAYGAPALNSDKTSSYTWMDRIVTKLIEKKVNLKNIVITGFSGGGQFVNRYAAFTKIVEKAKKNGVKVNFVVGGPGIYLYLREERPDENCDKCNDYIYGLEKRSAYKYIKDVSKSVAVDNVLRRAISYVVGDKDTNDDWNSPSDLAQGENRLDRFQKYENHIFWTCESLHPGQCPWELPFYEAPGSGHDLTVFDLPEIRKIVYEQ